MRRAIIISAILLSFASTFAQTIASIQDGYWQDYSTWDLGRLPQDDDTIRIRHSVTSDSSYLKPPPGVYLSIEDGGTLCLPQDTLDLDCGTFFMNKGLLYVRRMDVHHGLNAGLFYFKALYVSTCPVIGHNFRFTPAGAATTNWKFPDCAVWRYEAPPPPKVQFYPVYNVVLYPNPKQGDVFALITHPRKPPTGEERYGLELFDMLGKLVYKQENLAPGVNHLYLPPNLAKGDYFWNVYPNLPHDFQVTETGILMLR